MKRTARTVPGTTPRAKEPSERHEAGSGIPAPSEPKGKAFERLVAAVQRKLDPTSVVQWDIKVRARSGALRQIDVLRGELGGDSFALAVEAKDRSELVTINMVGDFYTAITGIGADAGLIVSNLGFTHDALLEAKDRGILTCILRPARDEDWQGYLRRFRLVVQMRTLIYEDAEIELVTGENISIPPHGMAILHIDDDSRGETVFFDHTVNGWLNENKWQEGQLVSLRVTRPMYRHYGSDEKLVEVVGMRFRPRYIDGLTHEHTTIRPEDYVFVQVTPEGPIDEKHFFELRELDLLAEQVRVARLAERRATAKTRRRRS